MNIPLFAQEEEPDLPPSPICLCCGAPARHFVPWKGLRLPFCDTCAGCRFALGGKITGPFGYNDRVLTEPVYALECPVHGRRDPVQVTPMVGPYPRKGRSGRTVWVMVPAK